MVFEGKVTRDHELIKRWANTRGGAPAIAVKFRGTEVLQDLQILFQDGEVNGRFEKITWDKFFEKFEREQLVFLYQDRTKDGAISRHCSFL